MIALLAMMVVVRGQGALDAYFSLSPFNTSCLPVPTTADLISHAINPILWLRSARARMLTERDDQV